MFYNDILMLALQSFQDGRNMLWHDGETTHIYVYNTVFFQ